MLSVILMTSALLTLAFLFLFIYFGVGGGEEGVVCVIFQSLSVNNAPIGMTNICLVLIHGGLVWPWSIISTDAGLMTFETLAKLRNP